MLVAENLTMAYGRRVLFRDLSIALSPGERLGVLGPNGSGKSTLLRILAGLETGLQGKAQWQGGPVGGHVGYLSPQVFFYPELSAQENLSFLAAILGRRQDLGLIEEVGLAGVSGPVGAFSSGQLQRLRWAAALLGEPPLLILDEPLTNLDSCGAETVRRALKSRPHLALVWATNWEEEVPDAHWIIRLADGPGRL